MKFSSLALTSAAALVLSGPLFAQTGPAIGTLSPCNNAIYDCESRANKVDENEVIHKLSAQLYKRVIFKVSERPKNGFVYIVEENAPVSVQRPTEFVVVPQSIGPAWAYVPK